MDQQTPFMESGHHEFFIWVPRLGHQPSSSPFERRPFPRLLFFHFSWPPPPKSPSPTLVLSHFCCCYCCSIPTKRTSFPMVPPSLFPSRSAHFCPVVPLCAT